MISIVQRSCHIPKKKKKTLPNTQVFHWQFYLLFRAIITTYH